MGPVKVASPMGAPSLVPPIGRPVSATGVPMYGQGDTVPATGTAPAINPHVAEAQRMEQSGTGVSQAKAKHPFWGGVLRGLDVAASIASPGTALAIPGTTLHHNALIGQQERLANQDVSREEKQAQTGDLEAQTQQRLNPQPKEEEQGKTVTTDEGIFQWNPQTHTYDTKVGDAPGGRGQVVQTDQGPILLPPGKTEGAPITVGGQPAKAPQKPGNDFEQYYKDYLTDNNLPDSSHNRLRARKEYAQAGHITVNSGNEGTWQMAEDEHGKTILYNSKTGETRAAPANLHAKGSFAKTVGPTEDAKNYATTYIQSGNFTGPGDEALQEKFFELAKPSTGFRMTQPQINQLQQSRNWMNGLEGRAYHALHGTWFSDSQRQQIVDTMNQLATAKEQTLGGSPSGAPTPGGGGMVNMTAPDGTTKPVPADQVEHYKSLGAKVAQ